MNLPKIFTKKPKKDNFDSLPSSVRKQIMKKAIRGANKEQYEIVKAYRASLCQSPK